MQAFCHRCVEQAAAAAGYASAYFVAPRAALAASAAKTERPIIISFRVTATHPAFEFVESVIVDGESGRRLQNLSEVQRGTTRHETLRFRVHAPIGQVKRTTTTAMRIMGTWQVVSTEMLEMGEYEPRGARHIHEFHMPKAVIPSTPFAKGRFKTEVEYVGCNPGGDEVLLRKEEDIEFTIV